MLQNPCKALGFKKNMVYKIPPGGGKPYPASGLLPFEPCLSICISGQAGSGKNRWVYEFLTHISVMYGGDLPTQMLYCYGFYQPLFDKMERTIKNFTIVFSRLK